MSYDIFFWKQSKRLKATPASIYERLNDGKSVRGVDTIPGGQIVDRLREMLPGFSLDQEDTDGQGGASADEVEVTWGLQHFRFDARFTQELHDQIVDLMMEFGCALYAPAVDRYHVKIDGFTPTKPKPPKVDIKVKVTRAVARSARDLGLEFAPLPATTRLIGADPEAFHTSPMLRNMRVEFTRDVLAVGYCSIGMYSAEGTGVLLEAFHRSPNMFICNYEHTASGVGWDEVIAVHGDQTLTIWSGELIDNHIPSWVKRVPLIGAVADRDRVVRSSLGDEAQPDIPADRFVSLAESFYAREMAWRASL